MSKSQPAGDLSLLSRDEATSFVNSFDNVLVDCDGVLWLGSRNLPGSREVINKLKDLGKKVFFVSNNATLTLDQYMEKFKSLGFKVEKDEIYIPSVVIPAYLKKQGFEKKAFIIGCSAFKETLKQAGIESITVDIELKNETLAGFKESMDGLDLNTGAVIMDFDAKLNYLKIMQATVLLRRTNALFLVGATDVDVPISENLILIGPGPIISMLESATGKKAIVAGKPGPIVAEIISEKHNLVPERTIMIGDSICQDVRLGNNCGFQTILVLSGVSRVEDISCDSNDQPTYYLRTLGDLLPFLP